MTSENDVQVKISEIHGRGVFALKVFDIGDVVLRWDTSKKVQKNNTSTLSEEELHFLVPYDSEFFIINQAPARFVNHSCSSNTEVVDFSDIATSRIEIGEEITSDYRGYSSASFDCNCGSKNCKSLIKK